LWNGPGGHIDPSETPLAAARREFSEETGLALENPQLAGVLLVDVGTSPGIGVFVFVGVVSEGEPRASREGDLSWFTPGEAAAAPTVRDLPLLLTRALAVLEGAPPFTALTTFAADGSPQLRFD
jgi:8-oxo-dGTP pyrophosphatase MutT (NUDIX family)